MSAKPVCFSLVTRLLHSAACAALSCALSTSAFAQTPPAKPASAVPAPQSAPSRPVGTSPADKSTPFPHYTDKARGWHFREPIPEDPVDEPVKPPAPTPTPAPPTPPAEPPGPKPLSPAWIRENLPKYLDAAIEDPSPQNVSNYLYLQKFSMDAAERFSSVYKRVVLSDANLDETSAVTSWSHGRQQLESAAAQQRRKLISGLSKKWGIWFFFRSDCQPCHLQAPVLDNFAKYYGFEVLPISMDGGPLPGSPFKKFVVDRGQAQKFGIDTSPTLVLVRPPDVAVPITNGLASMDDIEMRIMELGTQAGIFTGEQYQSTRIEAKRPLPSPAAAKQSMQIDPNNPNAMRDYLKSLISTRAN